MAEKERHGVEHQTDQGFCPRPTSRRLHDFEDIRYQPR